MSNRVRRGVFYNGGLAMTINDLTISEKTLIIELVAQEILRLEKANGSQDRIKEYENIILKIERM